MNENEIFRILTWNVAGRRKRTVDQLAYIGSLEPDLVALQEVTPNTHSILSDGLRDLGYIHTSNSIELAKEVELLKGPRRYGVLLASRFPLKVADPQLVSVPWQERLLSATVSTPSGAIEVCTIYVPTGSGNGPVKVETLEGLYDHLAKEAHHHRILCGDFNTPQRELESGEVVTFGQRIRSDGTVRTRSRVHGTDGRRWDEAERNVIRGLEKFDLPDVFRSVHGFGRKEASWFSFGGKKKRGFRLDHIFASRRLRPSEIYYDHAPRKDNLSDHSPLIASFYAAKGTTGGEVNRGFCADCGPPPLFSRVAMAPGDLLCGSATRFYRLENST